VSCVRACVRACVCVCVCVCMLCCTCGTGGGPAGGCCTPIQAPQLCRALNTLRVRVRAQRAGRAPNHRAWAPCAGDRRRLRHLRHPGGKARRADGGAARAGSGVRAASCAGSRAAAACPHRMCAAAGPAHSHRGASAWHGSTPNVQVQAPAALPPSCGLPPPNSAHSKVDLTDVEGPVLRNLRSCMVLNAPPPQAPSTPASPSSQHAPAPPSAAAAAAAAAEGQQAQLGQQAGLPADAETYDADADSVDELNFGALMLEGGGDKGLQGGGHARVGGGGMGGCNTRRHGVGGASTGNSSSSSSSWEAGNMRVRMLDWWVRLRVGL